ncbi:phosphatidylserine/phosphatidylglycerophosphate/cardiolipin synthase family protein [Verrucomicrobiaceae bacterium N1E253]|uniref:Phosphatidylserine/phosphatidylglycerophosphate/ cardiolipin synthase family protein n=1 Tax=Oceaniferula marina TaxID=2748318 RepID=A0A851GKI9_9BACT|nr:phosphatidylserine/phosphatidylglycerophosphate/cardiolipin synthase family protein [Oceaniferula marina]NWK56361.1 phosphatidylserine/phosphatidylglycerophosphate/cardiolipin synthase family protein [Oceaniferula marina]
MDDESTEQGIRLLSQSGYQSGDAADFAYRRIERCLDAARHSIEIHMYVWRADDVGHQIGRAVLRAADRGVRVKIMKDRGAVLYESQESNRKPFFPTPRSWGKRLYQRGLGMTFPRTWVQDDWDQSLGLRLMQHPKVDFVWVSPTHTKYYCIDERCLITGSLNLEDRHRNYHDVMMEIRGERRVEQFRHAQQCSGQDQASVGFTVLMNDPDRGRFEIKAKLLELVRLAKRSLHIEMAYLGDPDVTEVLVAAAQRGVHVTILFSEKANIGNDGNYHVLNQLMKSALVEVRMSSKMIHSKVMVIDGKRALFGSANFSVFSLQRAGELSFLLDGSDAVDSLNEVLMERWSLGRPVVRRSEVSGYWKGMACLQHWYQQLGRHR